MKLKLLVAASAVAFANIALADTYQAEVTADAVSFDSDYTKDKYNFYAVGGSYYFNAVNTAGKPLAEAAYLGKNSNVFAGTIFAPRQNGEGSWQTTKIGGEVYVPESFLYVEASGTHMRGSGETDNDWEVTAGITPIDGLRITTTYDNNVDYKINLAAKYVTAFGDGQFINVEAGIADTDNGTTKMIGGDFYFDRTFSVGAEFSDDDSDNTTTIRTRKFFTEAFSANLSYADAPGGNLLSVGVAYRF